MNDDVTIRRSRSKPQKPRCVFCGSTVDVERHHIGGGYHIAWFTMQLCRKHHLLITAALRQAGIEMSYTPNMRERLTRARMAVFVFLWMLEERLKEYERKGAPE
jgi:hypothetical protein